MKSVPNNIARDVVKLLSEVVEQARLSPKDNRLQNKARLAARAIKRMS